MNANMRGATASGPSAEWASVRRAIADALGGCPHEACFLLGLREVFRRGYGRVALQHRNGEPVAAQWRIRQREQRGAGSRPLLGRRDRRCEDADLRGLQDLIFDGIDKGGLSIPTDVSVRSSGDQIPVRASVVDMRERCAKWKRRAEEWSAKPRAGAAMVAGVQDFRLVWIGVHVTRGPEVEFS